MWKDEDLIQETEWSRTYANEDKTCHYFESKFLDSGVSVTLQQLADQWPSWSDSEKLDFCSAISCAPPENSADIFRFLAEDESAHIRSTIALCIAMRLPVDESLPMLAKWTDAAAPGERSNYLQAIAHTSHPDAHGLLQKHFEILCRHPQLMDDAESYNDIAMNLVWCMKHLLEIESPVSELQSGYDKLMQHPCRKIREQVDRWLSSSF